MSLGKVTVGRLISNDIIIENNTIKKNSGNITLKPAAGYSVKIVTTSDIATALTKAYFDSNYVINTLTNQLVRNKTFNLSTIVFKNNNKLLTISLQPSSTLTLTIPQSTGSVVFASTTQTLTNKTIPGNTLAKGIAISSNHVVATPTSLPVAGRILKATGATATAWSTLSHSELTSAGFYSHSFIDPIFGVGMSTNDVPTHNGTTFTTLSLGSGGKVLVASTVSGLTWDYPSVNPLATTLFASDITVVESYKNKFLTLTETSTDQTIPTLVTFYSDANESASIPVGTIFDIIKITTSREYNIPLRLARVRINADTRMSGIDFLRARFEVATVIKTSANNWYRMYKSISQPAGAKVTRIAQSFFPYGDINPIMVTNQYPANDPNYPNVVVPISIPIAACKIAPDMMAMFPLMSPFFIHFKGFMTNDGGIRWPINYYIINQYAGYPMESPYKKPFIARIAWNIIWLLEVYYGTSPSMVMYWVESPPWSMDWTPQMTFSPIITTNILVTLHDNTVSQILRTDDAKGMFAIYDTSFNIKFFISTDSYGASFNITTLYQETSTLGIKSIGIGKVQGKPCVFSYVSVNSTVKFIVADNIAGTSWPGTHSTFAITDAGVCRLTACDNDTKYNNTTDFTSNMYIISSSESGVISLYGTCTKYNQMFYKMYTFNTSSLANKNTWINYPLIYRNIILFTGCFPESKGTPWLCKMDLLTNDITVEPDPLRIGFSTDESVVSCVIRYDRNATMFAYGHNQLNFPIAQNVDV